MHEQQTANKFSNACLSTTRQKTFFHQEPGRLHDAATCCGVPYHLCSCTPTGIVHMHYGHSPKPWVGARPPLPAAWHHTPFAATWRSGLGAKGQKLGSAIRHPSVAYGQQTWLRRMYNSSCKRKRQHDTVSMIEDCGADHSVPRKTWYNFQHLVYQVSNSLNTGMLKGATAVGDVLCHNVVCFTHEECKKLSQGFLVR